MHLLHHVHIGLHLNFNKMKQRIIFVNLHGNEFLVKTLDKIIFKRSVAIKHKYLLDYLLQNSDYEVCTFLNNKAGSISYSQGGKFPKWWCKLEHNFVMKKNGIDHSKIKVLTKESEIRKDDVLIVYNYYANHYAFNKRPNCFIVACHIHFNTANADKLRNFNPDVCYNEANFSHGSKIYDHFYGWYKNPFITIPFVFGERFKNIKPFAKRMNKCFSTGTVTYMQNITPYYGDSCAQPARKQIMDNREELLGFVDCYNCNYAEDDEKMFKKGNSLWVRLYNAYVSKFKASRQKKYYSFNMVEKFNDYKMCLVGEEIMQIPGVGFVEGMACGTAYIGQGIGYYEDYGMKEGVHYIGYDGTIENLKAKIKYYQMPEHQQELENIAKTGCEFVRRNFCGKKVAENLMNALKQQQLEWKSNKKM